MIYNTQCCGVKEINGLSLRQGRPQDSMKELCREFDLLGHPVARCAIMMFTADMQHKYGNEFCNFIRRNKLGHVNASQIGFNPNSNHRVRAWMWQVNWEALIEWYRNNR